MDVDLSTGLDALLPLVAPLVNGHSDLSIGSRLALYYLFTSAALLLLHASAANPSRLLELSVLLVSSGLGTAGRFLLLRRWIFKPGKDN
jgi:hypothetical protein